MSERIVIPSPESLVAHAGFIRNVARKLLLDDHEVDDVVQQTLLAALQKPPTRPGPLKPWLATVARNLARMRRRTEGRIDRREQAAARPEAMPATGEIAARLETQRKLVEAVTSLDEPYRDVVVLRFFDELPPREVAQRLDLPVETVRTRTRRALEQLRGRLDHESNGDRKAWQLALLPLALPSARTQAVAATATVGLIGAIGMKSIFTIAAILFAAVLFLWNEASGNGDESTQRITEARGADESGGTGASPLTGDGTTAEERGGARGTTQSAPFVYRGRVVDEQGEPIRGALLTAADRGEFRTDGDGAITVDGIVGEHYLSFRLSADGFVPRNGGLSAWSDEPKTLEMRRGISFRVRVLSPAGVPVKGARYIATLREGQADAGYTWVDWSESRKGESDAEGLVDLGRIPDAELELALDHPEFAWFHGKFDKTDTSAGEIVVRLSAGGTVRGRVLGPDGEPVAGATVRGLKREAMSGSDGGYTLKHVRTNGPDISASHPSYGPARFGRALGWDTAIPVHVGEGGEVNGIDILLVKPTLVRGRFVDQDGTPVAGIKVSSYGANGFHMGGAVVSDEQGCFVAGPWGLRAETGVWTIFEAANETHRAPQGLKWKLRRGETIEAGDITLDTLPVIRGRVVGADGAPVKPSVMVTVEWGSGFTKVRPDGSFETRIKPGSHPMFASGSPDLRSESQRVEIGVNETREIELRLARSVEVSGSVHLSNGKPSIYSPVAIMPVGHDDSWRHGDGPRAGTGREGAFVMRVTKPGEYVIGVPRELKHKRYGFRPDVPTQRITIGTDAIEAIRFVVPAPQQKGVKVTGRVVSATTGKPVTNYSMRLVRYKFFMPDHTYFFGVRDSAGRFTQYAETPGNYACTVNQAGYSSITTKNFTVKQSGEIDLGTIRLPPALKLTGIVRDSNGTPVPFAQIHLLGGRGTIGGQAFTSQAGRFEIKDADAGFYNIFAVSPRHPVAIKKGITVKHGQPNTVEIVVPDTSPLTIKVRDEAGRPVEGAKLIWTFPAVAPFTSQEFGGYEPPTFGDNVSDAEGIIRKPYTPSAPISIRILKPGYGTEAMVVRTTKGEPKTVEIVLHAK